MQEGVTLREISYMLADGSRNAATSWSRRPAQAIGTPLSSSCIGTPTSNRTQFIPDAIALAKAGAVSLLIDTS